ncbi:hypothetical protein C8Q80DRAFT_1151462 [Daedaleopsis nitida]|nr:hypothetical protein C8Q80DRAFT_1151462 [Daedaleopsis nitida]
MTTYSGGDIEEAQKSFSSTRDVIIGVAIGIVVLSFVSVLIGVARKNNRRELIRNHPRPSMPRSQMQYYQPAAPVPTVHARDIRNAREDAHLEWPTSPASSSPPHNAQASADVEAAYQRTPSASGTPNVYMASQPVDSALLPMPFDAAYFPTHAQQAHAHTQAAPPATETPQQGVPDTPAAPATAAGREFTNPFLRQMARLTVVHEDPAKPGELRLEPPQSPAAGPSQASQAPGLRSQGSMQSLSVFSEPAPEYESVVAPRSGETASPSRAGSVRSGTLPPPYSPQWHAGGSAV